LQIYNYPRVISSFLLEYSQCGRIYLLAFFPNIMIFP